MKYSFQKEFGYTDQLKTAKKEFITADSRMSYKYQIGIALTGSISKIHLVSLIFLQIFNTSLSS